jgi:hypothetical protein
MTKAEQCAGNLAWWREHGRALIASDRTISDRAREGGGDREWIPTNQEIAKLRAVREAFERVPAHPAFTPRATQIATVGRLEPGMSETGRLCDLADFDGYDESAHLFQREAETVAVSDSDAETIRLRDSAFVWHCKNRAGEIVEPEVKEKADRAQKELRENGLNLALALSSAGVPAFLPKNAPRVSIVCPESEQRIDIAPLRRINFLPPIAKARRDPVVKQLEAFAEREGNCRMATFTAGQNVPVIGKGELVRERTGWLHRRISALNASELFKSHGAQMQLRASEYGTIKLACPWPRVPGTEAGVPFVHIHAHVVYKLKKQLSPRRWKRFLAKVKNKWRFHWDESGRLQNVREACKYPIKPGDYSHLTNEQVAAFYHATKGLHLVQPLGEFREEIAARREAALKAVRERDAKQVLKLKFKPDWNARIDRLTTKEKNARAAYREQQKKRGLSVCIKAQRLANGRDALMICALLIARHFARSPEVRARNVATALALVTQAVRIGALAETLLRFNPRPFDEQRLSGIRRMREDAKATRKARPMHNRIAARLAPAPYFDCILRPGLLVWNFDGDYAALRSEGFVREYLDAVRPQIQRAERAVRFLRVHTSHTTVESETCSVALLARAEAWSDPPPAAQCAQN